MSRSGDGSKNWVSFTGYVVQHRPDLNVFDAALARVREIYEKDLPVAVSFSGGKDSTCALMVTLMIARELGKVPIHVALVDEEVIDPDTLAYCEEVRSWPDVQFHWLCVPIRHTLRSQNRSHWFPWDPDEKDVWARQPPDWAITTYPGMEDTDPTYGERIAGYFRSLGITRKVQIGGVRAEEAFNRRRAVVSGGGYIHRRPDGFWAKPIYDWRSTDVWRAIIKFKWPHSAFYDKLWMKGINLKQQRVAVWGNVASAREARFYPEFYPDFWQQAIRRLPELRAAARYGQTKLYRERLNKPPGMTWQEYSYVLIERLPEEDREYWIGVIKSLLRRHSAMSTLPFPETVVYYPEDGKKDLMGWRYLAAAIAKNDRIDGTSRDIL